MARLRVKHFGPITEGFESEDGFIDFGKYTLFIGDQGTGKSTIAKLISLCSWLEKAFFRGDFDSASFGNSDFEDLCNNQLLNDSFNEDTELEYDGNAYHFWYKNSAFLAKKSEKTEQEYIRPKIMYIPSERNVLSIVKNVEELDNIPPMLRLLRKRYLQASSALGNDGLYVLPLSGYKTIVNKSNGETTVQEEKTGKAVPLICASSGLQSVVPSSLVTEYLASLSQQTVLEKIRSLKEKDLKKLKTNIADDIINSELERYITSGVSKTVSAESLARLETEARRFTNGCFMNIVEEPEQNLFPESQMKNLDFLLDAANRNKNNKLILTTHSPYILSYTTLAAKAFELNSKKIPANEIEKILPRSSWIDGNTCRVYQLEDGKIRTLHTYGRGLPSDSNMLNATLGKSNDMFDQLLDLEEAFDR